MMKELVVAYEYYSNCPVCDGSMYDGLLKGFNNEMEMINWAFENMNSYKIVGVYNVLKDTDSIYELKYIPELHHIRDLEIYKNNKLYIRTIDNGSGEKILEVV